MIQELLGGATATLIARERNSNYSSSINHGVVVGEAPPLQTTQIQSPSSSTTTINTTTSTPTTTTSSENQNLRCPRCDSSNTKFCYYNNYNLTQPRHFCKTCRRYWTKGGALRNVPIGGGCRRNRNIGVSSSSAAKTTTTKLKTVASEFIVRPSSLEHVVPLPLPNQILWGSPQNSHILSLLRSTQNQNQSPNPNLLGVGRTMKEEGNLMGSHSHSQSQSHMMMNEPLVSNGLVNHRNPNSYEGAGHALNSSFWRNNQEQTQQQNGGFLLGEQHQQQHHQNSSAIHELYQKLKSGSNNNYCSESSQVIMGNVVSSTSSMSNFLEPTSVAAGGELGYWNTPTLSWSDLPTTNGAYL